MTRHRVDRAIRQTDAGGFSEPARAENGSADEDRLHRGATDGIMLAQAEYGCDGASIRKSPAKGEEPGPVGHWRSADDHLMAFTQSSRNEFYTHVIAFAESDPHRER